VLHNTHIPSPEMPQWKLTPADLLWPAVAQVGLRPGRVRLRLELEHLDQAELQAAAEAAAAAAQSGGQESEAVPPRQGRGKLSDGLRVVHCYGHGGSGLTLAWGTAGDAVQLALKALQVEA
jgi:hypothetical protein